MRTRLTFGVLWLASAGLVTPTEEARPTVLRQGGIEHPGPATVDVSADGRFVAFESAVSLLPADRNKSVDIYVLDRSTGRVTLETVTPEHAVGHWTAHPRLSGDGRYLVFRGVPHDVPFGPAVGFPQVMLRDRRAGTTTLVSRTSVGGPANGKSGHADISDDGRTIVFESGATDLGGLPDRNGRLSDVYAFDVDSQTITRVSLDASGAQPEVGQSFAPSLSGDGRYVTFVSSVRMHDEFNQRLLPRAAQGPYHVYLRNLGNGFIRRVSAARGSKDANGASFDPAVSRDGGRVAFVSEATNLVQRDRNGAADVFLYDVRSGQTTLVSRSARGGSATGPSGRPALSADGRFVAFVSDASDLLCATRCPDGLLDLNLVADVYLFDTVKEVLARVSGARPRSPWWEVSTGPSLDAAGRVIAFSSCHPIDASDVQHDFDLFVEEIPVMRERTDPSAALRPLVP